MAVKLWHVGLGALIVGAVALAASGKKEEKVPEEPKEPEPSTEEMPPRVVMNIVPTEPVAPQPTQPSRRGQSALQRITSVFDQVQENFAQILSLGEQPSNIQPIISLYIDMSNNESAEYEPHTHETYADAPDSEVYNTPILQVPEDILKRRQELWGSLLGRDVELMEWLKTQPKLFQNNKTQLLADLDKIRILASAKGDLIDAVLRAKELRRLNSLPGVTEAVRNINTLQSSIQTIEATFIA